MTRVKLKVASISLHLILVIPKLYATFSTGYWYKFSFLIQGPRSKAFSGSMGMGDCFWCVVWWCRAVWSTSVGVLISALLAIICTWSLGASFLCVSGRNAGLPWWSKTLKAISWQRKVSPIKAVSCWTSGILPASCRLFSYTQVKQSS